MSKNTFIDKIVVRLVLFYMYFGCLAMSAQRTPRTYVVQKTGEVIQIDGKANEETWAQAAWSSDFIDIEGTKKPTYKTNMKMVWDDKNLYFFATMQEPHVWGTLKQRDTVIFYNNDFEIFIDPDGDTHNYMEFEMNALNTVWDLFLTKPYRNGPKVLDSWNIQGIETAVNVGGTLNNSSDTDTGWSVEIAMPWSVLTEANSHNDVPANEYWRINFSRVNWEFDLTDGRYSRKKDKSGNYLSEYNWVWSPQGVVNMHEPEHWGYVFFSDKKVREEASFKIPEDEHIKLYLYELYRDLIDETKRKAKWSEMDGQLTGPSKKLFDESIVPVLEKNKTGFLIYTKSPFTKRTLIIKDDGQFISSDE